jgi:hypothetical protein
MNLESAQYMQPVPKCPKHPKRNGRCLKNKTLFIKSPLHPEGWNYNFYYCKGSKKFYSNGKLGSKEEAALNHMNYLGKFSSQEEYKIEDLEVEIVKF